MQAKTVQVAQLLSQPLTPIYCLVAATHPVLLWLLTHQEVVRLDVSMNEAAVMHCLYP
jgi:hypothetical protein